MNSQPMVAPNHNCPDGDPSAESTAPEAATAPLLTPEALPILENPRDGVPMVVDTPMQLHRAAEALAAAEGPCALDVERASSFRYGQRAFLVQLRRSSSGTWLIDPEALPDLSLLNEALGDAEWILHAATQDLPSLSELKMWPSALFDTELAARIAGLPRVGLAAVVAHLLGFCLAKEHSAVDWSTRPLPEPWLQYAALDVEVLIELREQLVALLQTQGKLEWVRQECQAIIAADPPAPRPDPWRRTSGIHKIHDRRQLAIVRQLWTERDKVARARDLTPSRVLADAALIAAAHTAPQTPEQLLAIPGFAKSRRHPGAWLRAIQIGFTSADVPPLHLQQIAPPPPRNWAERDPAAWQRLQAARKALLQRSEILGLPAENLLSPHHLRQVAWEPPQELSEASLTQYLSELGARPWQIENCVSLLWEAFKNPVKKNVFSAKDNEI